MPIHKWTERFQCLMHSEENTDAVVQVFFKRSIEGHDLDGLEEHQLKLSQLPHLRELLDTQFVEELEKSGVPAADRLVSRNDNSKAYDEAISAIEDVEKSLRESNQFMRDKDESLVELSSTRKLMEFGRVKLVVLGHLAYRTLKKLSAKAVDEVIKRTVAFAVSAVGILLAGAVRYFWP